MLTAVIGASGDRAEASTAQKTDKPFSCPKCKSEVTLKRGKLKIAHFAHKPPVTCKYGAGESEDHRKCKLAILEAMRAHPQARDWQLERDLGDVVPDVSGYFRGLQVAIEIQRSTLGLEEIAGRTKEYARRGVFVLWLVLPRKGLPSGERYAPSAWERWLHALNFGRVYYWVSGATIQPVHFNDHWLYVEATDFGGGYSKRSKRYRTPVLGPVMSLTDNFAGSRREAWLAEKMSVPECFLFVDALGAWWQTKE